jgi:Zn-dependent peptidase ImmA (M78 family)
LMTQTAHKLTGKNVRVRLKIPATRGCVGECHADENGRVIIDISPNLDDETMLYVFAHECAHAFLHTFKPSNLHSQMPGSAVPNENNLKSQVLELTADELANDWVNYAKSNGDDFEDWLCALLERHG